MLLARPTASGKKRNSSPPSAGPKNQKGLASLCSAQANFPSAWGRNWPAIAQGSCNSTGFFRPAFKPVPPYQARTLASFLERPQKKHSGLELAAANSGGALPGGVGITWPLSHYFRKDCQIPGFCSSLIRLLICCLVHANKKMQLLKFAIFCEK